MTKYPAEDLYISDLDGTLFGRRGEMSAYTQRTLKDLTARGLNFTIATARTPVTIGNMFDDVKLSAPAILMNGVVIYDVAKKEYVKSYYIPRVLAGMVVRRLRMYSKRGMMYTLRDGHMQIYYETVESEHQNEFIRERVSRYGQEFVQTDSLTTAPLEDVIYFVVPGTREHLQPIYNSLSGVTGITMLFYKELYEKEERWLLEIFSGEGTKRSAALYIKENYGYKTLIGFGDNYNDLSLFEACDRCYAVANAEDAVKQAATEVIGANTEDGVVDWILRREKSGRGGGSARGGSHVSAVAIVAAVCVLALFGVFFWRLLAAHTLNALQSSVIALALAGVAWAMLRGVPAIEQYTGVRKPTVIAKDSPWLVYAGVAAWVAALVVVMVGSILAQSDKPVTDAILALTERLTSDAHTAQIFAAATDGYAKGAVGATGAMPLMPVYPILLGLVGRLFESVAVAALTLNSALTFLLGVMLYKLARLHTDHADAARAVKLALLFPLSFTLLAPGEGTLFLLLTVTLCHALEKKRVLPAFACAFLAAMTQHLGILVIVPIIIDDAAALNREKDARRAAQLGVTALAPLLAFSVYMFINTVVYGGAFYFATALLDNLRNAGGILNFTGFNSNLLAPEIAGIPVVAVLLVAIVALTAYGAKRLPSKYTTFAAMTLIASFLTGNIAVSATLAVFPCAIAAADFTQTTRNNRIVTVAYAVGFVFLLGVFAGKAWR
ncbi:MAG: HAD family hydrolase [Oscillospiraceae bacterium]|nr:HAD family hydrolase [Oscillospiraceae bacterium]